MEQIDLHGLNIIQMERRISRLVGEFRLQERSECVRIITGLGSNRHQVKSMLSEVYGLEPKFETGNDGAIIVLVE